jgi:hypothetical protein
MSNFARFVSVVGVLVAAAMAPAAAAAPGKAPTKTGGRTARRATPHAAGKAGSVQTPTPAPMQNRMTTDQLGIPTIEITSFHKKPNPGTALATTGVGGAAGSGGEAPDSAQITVGESITLSWRIRACNVPSFSVTLNDSPVSAGTSATSGNCDSYVGGESTMTPSRTTSYTLVVRAYPYGARNPRSVSKTFRVDVIRPIVDILRPEVNESTLDVSVSVRNTGMMDIGPGPITVSYQVKAPAGGASIASGSFTTDPMTISRGTTAELGSFSLAAQRDTLLEHDNCQIYIAMVAEHLDETEGVIHTWPRKTFAINNILMPGLSTDSAYNIRLNNYGGGVHPYVRNDCRIEFNFMDAPRSFARSFNFEPYYDKVFVSGPPFPWAGVNQKIAIYANHITAVADPAPADFLSIQGGKLLIHVTFPNSGSRELKIGFDSPPFHKGEFVDDKVADVELGPFSVDILLTPQLRGGKISYGAVEVRLGDLSSSLVGALADPLNKTNLVRDLLNGTLRDIIVGGLTAVIDDDDVRDAFEDGIATALAAIHIAPDRIYSVRGSGDTITVEYR